MTVLLVLGGARSGKSRYSETRLEALPGDAQLAYLDLHIKPDRT